jgi:hypothetical protein
MTSSQASAPGSVSRQKGLREEVGDAPGTARFRRELVA